MSGWMTIMLTLGGLMPSGSEGKPGLSEPAVVLPEAVARDRRRLTDAVKKASRIGDDGRPTAADFDAVTVGWGRQAAHLYILPLAVEEALRKHDAEHPDARLGGLLDVHADANLVLCVGGVHEMIEELLCERLTALIGRKVEPATIVRLLVDHLAALPKADHAKFIAEVVAAQRSLRSAVRQASLGLVSDEPDSAKVIRRVGELGAEPADVVQRIAEAKKQLKAAFEHSLRGGGGK